jgi:hypothetical protein
MADDGQLDGQAVGQRGGFEAQIDDPGAKDRSAF